MKSILIATAKTDYLIMLTNLLQKRGYVVIPAVDADFALSFLRQGTVDAVIADYEWADVPGFIREASSQTPVSPPVIVVSGRVVVNDYLTALSAGAFDFIFWPIRPSEFLRIVAAALRHHTNQINAGEHTSNVVMTDTFQRAVNYS